MFTIASTTNYKTNLLGNNFPKDLLDLSEQPKKIQIDNTIVLYGLSFYAQCLSLDGQVIRDSYKGIDSSHIVRIFVSMTRDFGGGEYIEILCNDGEYLRVNKISKILTEGWIEYHIEKSI